MGLMDRVKQQASSLAQQANQSMAKLDNLPAQRRADSLLRSLGVAVLADKTGRATADTEAQITQILADIAQHEQQYNVDLVQQAAQTAQMQQPWQPGAPGQPGQPWQPGAPGQPGQPWQPGAPGQPGQQGQPGQPGQGWQQPPGDYLASAPPADPNVSAAPAAPGSGPGYGGAPGYGGQPMSGPPGWNEQGTGQKGGQAGFPGAAPGSFPRQGGQAGGATGFPPATSFPQAQPLGTPDEGDDPGHEQGNQNYFPPASGV